MKNTSTRSSKTPLWKPLKSIGKIKTKADKRMQDFYRKEWEGKRCEMCGGEYACLHHFIEKHLSNFLRYEIKNCVRVCASCHYKFHHPDPVNSLNEKLKKMRGEAWVEWIEDNRRKEKRDNRKEIEELFKVKI